MIRSFDNMYETSFNSLWTQQWDLPLRVDFIEACEVKVGTEHLLGDELMM